MITELGHFTLVLALILSLMQAAVPLIGVQKKITAWMALASRAGALLFLLLTISFAALMHAYAVSDFSVWGVVANSHTMMPLPYKIAAVWGNHEGSMLLWVWMLSVWGFFTARAQLPAEFKARALACQGMIAFGFILFILFTSNPFRRIMPPAPEGMGLNPILQDPALAIHPPLLYAGYVGFSVAFSFAVAALLEKKVDAEWARRLRPWVLTAWIFLTAGIVKGSLWAYYELGWGGFWFWDPVENASLMPWLAGTALLHSTAVLEKRGTLKAWTVFLSILAFSFSLLGTFLVRSGILTSVHTFASDPTRGIFILALLTVAIGGAFLLYALRAPYIKSGAAFSALSRESMLLLNNVFLFAFCATVFTGTLYPVFLNALDLGSVSVGPPYYRATLLPMLVPFALLMGAAPYMAWQKSDVGVFKKMLLPLLFTGFTLVPVFLKDPAHPLALLGFALGAWIVWATLADALRKGSGMPLSYLGMVTAHIGFALLIMGVAAATQWGQEKIIWMSPGDRIEIAGRTLAFLGTHESLGPDYNADTGIFTLDSGTFMTPEKRWYPVAQKETTEVALHLDAFSLVYLAIGETDAHHPERRVVRAYYHPFITWVFGGGFLMYIGGILSVLDRRRRKA